MSQARVVGSRVDVVAADPEEQLDSARQAVELVVPARRAPSSRRIQ
jgi:hypothetical protein